MTETSGANIDLRALLLDIVRSGYERGVGLIEVKNSDYASVADPFKNFRRAALVAGISTERALLVRIGDKLGRIENCLNKKLAVNDESIEDTLLDVINYLALFRAFRQMKDMLPSMEAEEETITLSPDEYEEIDRQAEEFGERVDTIAEELTQADAEEKLSPQERLRRFFAGVVS